MKRRRGVDLSLLPPLETLVPEELKNYTKEELSAYLQSQGIQPKITKPEMKRQLRLVLQALRENKPDLIAQLQQDTLRDIIDTPARKLRSPADFPRVRCLLLASHLVTDSDGQPHVPMGLQMPTHAGTQSAEGDGALCVGPGCRKKANRECDFTRCRSCCTRDGAWRGPPSFVV